MGRQHGCPPWTGSASGLVKGHRLWRIPEVRLAAWGALLNVAWELLQSPLYADHARRFSYVLWTRIHCTGGDVLILLGTFWCTSILFRSRHWWAPPRWAAAVLFVLLGLAYTVWSEWYNTQVRHSWEYSGAMPLLFGLGFSPLLQWLLLPPAILALLRRFALGVSDHPPSRPAGCAANARGAEWECRGSTHHVLSNSPRHPGSPAPGGGPRSGRAAGPWAPLRLRDDGGLLLPSQGRDEVGRPLRPAPGGPALRHADGSEAGGRAPAQGPRGNRPQAPHRPAHARARRHGAPARRTAFPKPRHRSSHSAAASRPGLATSAEPSGPGCAVRVPGRGSFPDAT